MSKRKLPPTSQRYCACCKDEITFKYNRNIGHSCCIECGWHYIPTLDPTGMYAKEVELFEATKKNKIPTEKEKTRNSQMQILKRLKSFKYRGQNA